MMIFLLFIRSKLNNLSTSWSRSKKSSRCALHSLDAQRYVRPPLGSGWRALWECMVPFCKQEVATIDTSHLLSTLEMYLQKHRYDTSKLYKICLSYLQFELLSVITYIRVTDSVPNAVQK